MYRNTWITIIILLAMASAMLAPMPVMVRAAGLIVCFPIFSRSLEGALKEAGQNRKGEK